MSNFPKDFVAHDAVAGLKRAGLHTPAAVPALRNVPGELAGFLEVAESGYAICICNAPAERMKVLAGIAPRLAAADIGVLELELAPGTRSVTAALREAVAGPEFRALAEKHARVALSVSNLTDAVLPAEREADRRPVPFQGLNQQRDWVRKLGRPVLFWVSEWLAGRLARWAPDFWVGRSVTLEFPTESEFIARAGQELHGDWTGFASLDEARRKVSIYEDLLRTARTDRDRATYLGNLGGIFAQLGELDRAQDFFTQVLRISKGLHWRDSEAKALGNIGLIWQDRGELGKALEYYEKALKVFEELGAKQEQASVLGNIGSIWQLKGDLDKALEYQEKSAAMHHEMGNSLNEAQALGNIGNIWQDRGELDKALEYQEKALKVFEELGTKREQASVLGNIGNIWQLKGELDKALEYQEKALAIDREFGNRLGEAQDLGSIGLIWKDKGELDKALEYQEKAVKVFEELGAKREQASVLGNIGLIWRRKGELDKALEYQEKALEIDRELGNKQGEAQSLGNIGLTYVMMMPGTGADTPHPNPLPQGERETLAERAVGPLATALSMFLQMDIADGPRQCLWGLGQCYKAMGSPSPSPSPQGGEGRSGREAFVAACVKAGMEEKDAGELAEQAEARAKAEVEAEVERRKQYEEHWQRFRELGRERFIADCVERGYEEADAREAADHWEKRLAEESESDPQ